MLKDRLTPFVSATLTIMLLGGALLLGGYAPQAAAAPMPVLTASAQPPTPTTPPPPPPSPTVDTSAPTATAGVGETPTPEVGDAPRAERRADPAVSKDASQDEVSLGGEVTYEFTITNEGNDVATGVIVEDSLPSYLELVDVSVDKGQAVKNGNTAGLWIGNVEPGEVVRGSVTARVVAIPADGVIVNQAVLHSNSSTDRPSNNLSDARVRVRQGTVTPTPAAGLDGSPTPSPTPVGGPGSGASGPEIPPSSLPVTAGVTSLPLGVLGLVVVVALGYMAAGLHFWRRPRR